MNCERERKWLRNLIRHAVERGEKSVPGRRPLDPYLIGYLMAAAEIMGDEKQALDERIVRGGPVAPS